MKHIASITCEFCGNKDIFLNTFGIFNCNNEDMYLDTEHDYAHLITLIKANLDKPDQKESFKNMVITCIREDCISEDRFLRITLNDGTKVLSADGTDKCTVADIVKLVEDKII